MFQSYNQQLEGLFLLTTTINLLSSSAYDELLVLRNQNVTIESTVNLCGLRIHFCLNWIAHLPVTNKR